MTPEEFESLETKLQNIRNILAETAAMNREAETRADHQKTVAILRRAVREALREARADRERRRIANQRTDQLFAKLAAAQLVTEEKLQRFLESTRSSAPDPISEPAS